MGLTYQDGVYVWDASLPKQNFVRLARLFIYLTPSP